MPATKTKRVKKGMQFRSTLADGNPLWVVKRSLGGAWLCEVVDEPYEIDGKVYESDYTGAEKSFLSREILAANAYEAIFKSISNDHDRFYASLDEGDIVHYNNGFKNFVRCEVVFDADEQKNQLQPIALVGEWSNHDLPKRRANGEVYNGYYAQKIIDGETFEPNVTCIFEAGTKGFVNDNRNHGDPRSLPPVDLSVPAMTEEEEQEAVRCQLIGRVQEIISEHGNTQEIINRISSMLSDSVVR
jgi:hypothetical protein